MGRIGLSSVSGKAWRGVATVMASALMFAIPAPSRAQEPRAFATPEAAVEALKVASRASDIEGLVTLFGAEGRELASSADPATARQNRTVFVVAMGEGWRLVDVAPDRKELVVGHEDWPFPVPLVKTARGWAFDAGAGREEVLARRIGRNELAVIRIAETYVRAQRAYAKDGHDGRPGGIYARRFSSSPGAQDGLYWPVAPGEPRSPLGELVAQAAAEGRQLGAGQQAVPFHGYHFRVLERQGAAAKGGARSYLAHGVMSRGFALVAWPAQYGATGIMTFVVGPDGVVYERDLGPDTAAAVPGITAYDPDRTWRRVVAAGAR